MTPAEIESNKLTKCNDVSEFLGVKPEEVIEKTFKRSAALDSKTEWLKDNPQTSEDRDNWYKNSVTYLYDLIWFEQAKETISPVHPGLLQICQNNNYKKILDFGGGTGGTLFYITNRFPIKAFYYDLETIARKFAEFRIKKYQTPDFNFLNSEDEVNDHANYDMVIALDVLEHLNNPLKYASWLVSITRPGGMVYISAPFSALENYPMHLESNLRYVNTFEEYMVSLGLKKVSGALWQKNV